MADGIVRRTVDARLVSYGMAILSDPAIVPLLRTALPLAVPSVVQARGGMLGLLMICRTAASSPVLEEKLDGRQREQVRAFFSGLANALEETMERDLKELFEVVLVCACATSESWEEEARWRQFAQGLLLDSRPLAIVEDDQKADVEEDTEVAAKRHRVRKPRSARETYQHDRLENLVARAIASGVTGMHPELASGQVCIVGTNARGQSQRLLKLRASMDDAQALCDRAVEEIAQMDAVDPAVR